MSMKSNTPENKNEKKKVVKTYFHFVKNLSSNQQREDKNEAMKNISLSLFLSQDQYFLRNILEIVQRWRYC